MKKKNYQLFSDPTAISPYMYTVTFVSLSLSLSLSLIRILAVSAPRCEKTPLIHLCTEYQRPVGLLNNQSARVTVLTRRPRCEKTTSTCAWNNKQLSGLFNNDFSFSNITLGLYPLIRYLSLGICQYSPLFINAKTIQHTGLYLHNIETLHRQAGGQVLQRTCASSSSPCATRDSNTC